ncbi:DEKNAAC105008 [Brettanomyces naardenensis]|uniref:DEKNAAC105008 n=1 Tax=Brettanomyces naardenensis TaxID=13370 RepID=A0A448YSI5_BRENA|nr:DEKNAAC105008 [Brettanomyces naardenensis]
MSAVYSRTVDTSQLKPSQFFSRRVSFDDYKPDIIEPSDVLLIHPPPYRNSSPSDSEDDLHPSSQHLKPILKKTMSEPPRSSATRLYEIPGTGVKKSLLDMTDQEILLLDSQFSKKQIDVEKNYRFDSDPRLSPVSNPAAARKGSTNGFKFLNMTDYPTKPIIKKNSICLNFRHSKYTQELNSNKFYLILISKYKSSLTAIDFYLENYSKNGDNLVICASISNVFKEDILEDCILQLVELILDKFVKYNKDLAVQINFEFFRNINYMSETLNLYQPSLIIVGSRESKNKYTSIATSTKNFVPLVYVGTDYESGLATKAASPLASLTMPASTSALPSHTAPRVMSLSPTAVTTISGVTFRSPFSQDSNVLLPPEEQRNVKSPRSLSPSLLSPSASHTEDAQDDSRKLSTTSDGLDSGSSEYLNEDGDEEDSDDVDDEEESGEPTEASGNFSKPAGTKPRPMFPFLNAVPHLDHISRADREAQTSLPGNRAQSTPSLGTTDLTKTKSNPASFSGPAQSSSSTYKSMPKLSRTTTVPAVITPELREKNAMFERYNRRLSSVKVQSQSERLKAKAILLASQPVSRTDSTDSTMKDDSSGRRRSSMLMLKSKPKPKVKSNLEATADYDAIKSSSSSDSSLTAVDEGNSINAGGFFKKLWKRK